MQWARLNLPEIDCALQGLGASNPFDDESDGPLALDWVRCLAEGYRHVDRLLAARTEIFAYGQTGEIVELNHLVLCGASPERRALFADHIAETERWFYERPGEGIAEVFDWYQRNRTRPPRPLAAGMFVQVVSSPQLFIEGNRRTAALLASYLLARAGLPPLVVGASSLERGREVAERCSTIDRSGFASGVAIALAAHRVSEFLLDACEPRFLLAPSPADAPR